MKVKESVVPLLFMSSKDSYSVTQRIPHTDTFVASVHKGKTSNLIFRKKTRKLPVEEI